MKILVVTKTPLNPPSDGLKLRISNFFRCLAEKHQIFNLYLDSSPLPRNFENYDIVVLGGYGAIKGFSAQIDTPVVVDLVDDVYLNFIRGIKFEPNLLRKLQLLKWAFDQQKVERGWGRRYQSFIVASPQDAISLRRFCPEAKITTIANGVDTKFFNPNNYQEAEYPTLVFSGSMDYAPNDDAGWVFLNKIYPLIKKRFSALKVIIVGKSPSKRIRHFAEKDTNVMITGLVDDIRLYIAKATAYICPLRWGTGIKNKILEAWAMGKAIVATSVSCEGLKTADGENILIADSAIDFAKATIRVIEDNHLRYQLGKNGRKLVEEEYLWEQKAKEYEVFLKEALKQR